MLNRRIVLAGLVGAASAVASGVVLAKGKHHLNGNTLLGDKVKKNGKHKLHTAGKSEVVAEVSNGKVVGLTAPGMSVKKVRSKQKMADGSSNLILARMDIAQTDVYYYGYWVYDANDDYYYWFTTDVVIVDGSWSDYTA